jgi:predicted nucleic acid-binding protein
MRFEIQKHWAKLLKISKLTDEELHVSYDRVISKIRFINEELIPAQIWQEAVGLVADIDIDDIDFVALKTFLDGKLWTGDKPLYTGLQAKNVAGICNTADLLNLRTMLYNQEKP